ncbi:hypothetical protein MT344_13705 [Clavibacter michiganensis subsp. phaseoli]|uniref:hypothetical protein n=1 Tax=Clavibacter phaseoli TaxID=1734031 RepID=UPI001FB50564|nr:hypothetical protein [Clavibacter phaseoli]MCJ1712235.1 hypothetical protein [Clavibacter phaseoli]
MIPSARSRPSPLLALTLALAVGASLAGAAPATAASGAPLPLAPAVAGAQLPAPDVVAGGEVTDVPAIEVHVSVDVGGLDLRSPRFEYLLDGAGSWRTAYSGPLDSAVIRIAASAGPHAIAFRAAGVVDGTPVVGAASASVAVRSLGHPTPYSPVVTVDGPRITVSWDVRAALAGWPKERSVAWSFDSGVETVADAVGSTTFEPGYDRTVQLSFRFGGNVDIARHVLLGITTSSAPGSVALTSAPGPAILGHAAIGTTLTVRTGVWRPAQVTLAYRWERDGVAIPGETGPAYRVGPEDAGARITVVVRGSAPGRISVERTSAATPRVGPWALTPGTPVVGGIAAVGRELTARPGSWRPAPVTLSYRWLRDGATIPGAIGDRYTVTVGDRGHVIAVAVTGAKPLYPDAVRVSAGRRIG